MPDLKLYNMEEIWHENVQLKYIILKEQIIDIKIIYCEDLLKEPVPALSTKITGCQFFKFIILCLDRKFFILSILHLIGNLNDLKKYI